MSMDAKPTKYGVVMTLISADGDMGFPGNRHRSLAFQRWLQGGAPAIIIRYTANDG